MEGYSIGAYSARENIISFFCVVCSFEIGQAKDRIDSLGDMIRMCP